MGLRELFQAMVVFFNREKIEYAVIGAFSLQAYGYVRATKDIDFLTRIEYQEKITKYLESLGFETLQKSEAFSNHLHPVGNVRIDIMYVNENTAGIIFSSVKNTILFGTKEVSVASPEHLIALKLFAAQNEPDRKYREFADIQEIVSRIEVDKNKIKEYFTKYGFGEMYEKIVKQKK